MKISLTLQVLKQAAVLHKLCDDVDGLLHGADGVQLDQLGMPQPLHDLSLSQEVLRIHGTWERWSAILRSNCFGRLATTFSDEHYVGERLYT